MYSFHIKKNLIIRKIFILIVLITIINILFACNRRKLNQSYNSKDSNIKFEEALLKEKILCVASVDEIDVIGDAIFDINPSTLEKVGINYGDSLDIAFSNGYIAKDIPYYNDFFGSRGSTMLVNLNGMIKLGGQYYDFVEAYNIKENDKVEIRIHEKGKYLSKMNLYQLPTGYMRSDYKSDEEFTNFRNVAYGEIAPYTLYRSASPISDKYGRSKILGNKIKSIGIKTILNLADTKEKANSYKSIPDNILSMIKSGDVIFAGTGVNFYDEQFRDNLAKSLGLMIKKEPPYLIHCSLGRDRTGFVCALLEALMGASYEEITEDYMQSFEWVNMLNKKENPEKYDLYKKELDEIFKFLTSTTPTKGFEKLNLEKAAYNYLLNGGMSKEEIELLKNRLRDGTVKNNE